MFPYLAAYTKIDGYVTYGDEAKKRLPFKLTGGDKVGHLYLKVPSKPGHTAHLHYRDDYFHGTLCRLMVVEGR